MRTCLLIWLAIVLIGCGRPSAPEFQVTSLATGSTKKLADFKGKVVLIDFWATWCGPCRETMPGIQKLYNMYAEKGVEIVAITDESEAVAKGFLSQTNFTYPVYLDPDRVANAAFGITEIPVSIVLDKEGGIVWRGHPGEEDKLEEAIKAALN